MAKPSEPNRNPKYDPKKKPHITEEPITRANWYKHVNWLNITLIVGVPIYGMIAAYWTPLQLKTALFAFAYYFMTGLGITAGTFSQQDYFEFSPLTFFSQVTTDFGHTPPTQQPFLSRFSSPQLVVEPFRVQSDGGQEITELITVTPIPTRTHTLSARGSSTPTSDGCS